MTYSIYSVKPKYILIFLITALIWQFSFPQSVSSLSYNTDSPMNALAQKFNEQWSVNSVLLTPHLPINPDKPIEPAKKILTIPVTAYSSTPGQTSGNPFITASGSHVRDGVVAANFLPIGTKVRFPDYYGNKVFIIEDRMHQRYWQKADIWMTSRQLAKDWGVRYTTIEIL